jgi:hypothetical protein
VYIARITCSYNSAVGGSFRAMASTMSVLWIEMRSLPGL